MIWSKCNIGKWRNRNLSLPQIICRDPDWFYHLFSEGAFKYYLADEANIIARRGRSIKLPAHRRHTSCIWYMRALNGELGDLGFVPIEWTMPEGRHSDRRQSTLDLSISWQWGNYDKAGGQIVTAFFKKHYFSGAPFIKNRLEPFFDDPTQFENP